VPLALTVALVVTAIAAAAAMAEWAEEEEEEEEEVLVSVFYTAWAGAPPALECEQ
jgi:hypothetical protein